MNEDEVAKMLSHARAFLQSAMRNRDQGSKQTSVAFDEARHAAEVAGKALFLKKTGRPAGKLHDIGGRLLAPEGLIPKDLDPKRLNVFLAKHTRGAYDYFETVDEGEVDESIRIARVLIEAAEAWPEGMFHPPQPLG